VGGGDADRDVLSAKSSREERETLRGEAETALGGRSEAEMQLVEALIAAADGVAEAGEYRLCGETRVSLTRVHEVVTTGAVHASGESGNALLDAMLRGSDELGGGGGRGGAEVGYEICDGEVGLVADRRDNRKRRGSDSAGEGLVVETGEVFHGAAASGDEDEVGSIRICVEPADAGGDGSWTAVALHGRGIDEQIEARVAAANDGSDIADDRAGGRSDDTDALREGGEWALAVGVEEALGEETSFELLERELERTGAARFHGFGDELKLAAALVDGDATADEDSKAICRTEAEKLGLTAEEDDRELGFAVLEGEVNVTGGRGAAVGDLALDPKVREGGLDVLADVGDECPDGPDAALCAEGGRGRWLGFLSGSSDGGTASGRRGGEI
jgi:hypothetical protein